MPSPQIKTNKQDRIINHLFNLYDALHAVNSSTVITDGARDIIILTLNIEVQKAQAKLASAGDGEDDENDDLDVLHSNLVTLAQR